jgi:glycosyltransferase involved in cell wall biosynthesis
LTTIGIDARAATEDRAGRGRVLRELLQALARRDDDHRYVLFGREPWRERLDERFRWRLRRLPDPAWNLWAGLDAGRRSDVFLSTNSYLTAWFTRVPTAVVVYDTIAWDAPDSAQRRAQRIERATIRPGLQRADAAICISEATRRDLVARFPSVAPKASVVPLAASERFHDAEPRDRGSFVLCVGTLEPRKNLVRAIQAHEALNDELRVRHPLVIAGARGWEGDEILQRAAAAGARILTDVPEGDLVELYSTCAVFLFPSLYEGFGLPLLEAMSTGAPCVTSNLSSLPEVGGDAVRYVTPTSVDEIHDVLEDLLRSPEQRAQLSEKARARAAGLSWDRTAEGVLATLLQIVER